MNSKGTIYSIAISVARGELKEEVYEAMLIANYGIEKDGHAGDWHRQVTCLALSSVEKANKEHGLQIGAGSFAENIIIAGLELSSMPVGSRLKLGAAAILEVTQIGKEDTPSIVSRTYGVSLLPSEGLFCKVVSGGKIKKNDHVELL